MALLQRRRNCTLEVATTHHSPLQSAGRSALENIWTLRHSKIWKRRNTLQTKNTLADIYTRTIELRTIPPVSWEVRAGIQAGSACHRSIVGSIVGSIVRSSRVHSEGLVGSSVGLSCRLLSSHLHCTLPILLRFSTVSDVRAAWG